MNYTFEHRPLADRPDDLIAEGGDDQWTDTDDSGTVVSAAVVMDDHVIVWQDTPLTDEGKQHIADYLRARGRGIH